LFGVFLLFGFARSVRITHLADCGSSPRVSQLRFLASGSSLPKSGSPLNLLLWLCHFPPFQQIAISEISSINDRITAQQGGGTSTRYYDIELTLRDGKRITLGRSIRDKHEVEWLVEEMRRNVGLNLKGSAVAAS
jgi:hypothetical protein